MNGVTGENMLYFFAVLDICAINLITERFIYVYVNVKIYNFVENIFVDT